MNDVFFALTSPVFSYPINCAFARYTTLSGCLTVNAWRIQALATEKFNHQNRNNVYVLKTTKYFK